ncbi:MAG: threonine/serine exporter family protein [Evtepia sp.]
MGYPRIAITVPSIVIMVPGLYFYRAVYNLGIMDLTTSASWMASALLIVLALPLGLIFCPHHDGPAVPIPSHMKNVLPPDREQDIFLRGVWIV